MPQPAETFDTYDAIGNREDLANAIYDISPTETPFMSGIAKTTATATNHEWQTDALAAASSTNAVIEGDDATTTAIIPTVRLGNFTQISDKVPRVTGTQRAVDSAGRADEMAYQLMKSSKELKRDVESSLLANNAKVAGDSSTARECAGVESWLATNFVSPGGGSAPTGDGTDTNTPGTPTAFDEADLKQVIAACWNEGGEPDTIMVGAFNKQALSGFVTADSTSGAGPAQRVVTGDANRVNTAIDFYVSDFGVLSVIPNRFQVQTSALVLDLDMWAMATLRDFQQMDLAKTGDTDRKQLLVEYTLASRNEAASGIVAGLTTS